MTYHTAIIKKLSARRGHGPDILKYILDTTPLQLRKFRAWNLCVSTVSALSDVERWTDEQRKCELDLVRSISHHDSWVCLFTGSGDIKRSLEDLLPKLQYKFGPVANMFPTTHPADTVLYVTQSTKQDLIASILFETFDETSL